MNVVVQGEKTRVGLRGLQASIRAAIGQTLASAVEAAKSSAQKTTLYHDRTGETRASIRSGVFGDRGFVSASGAMRFLEEGTVPHVIVGNPILRFVVDGQVLYRRWVRHPGSRPRPVMGEARERGIQAAEYGAELYLNYAIQRAH